MMSTASTQFNESTPSESPPDTQGLKGFIPCQAITEEDKKIEIAAIAFMIQKDLILLKKACHELAPKVKEEQTVQVEIISQALESLQLYAADILKLTDKKEYTRYAASRQT